jgi:hypothetical protein
MKPKVSPRTLARFQRAAAQYGGKVIRAEWEPLGVHMVFDGPMGGWTVDLAFPGRHQPIRETAIGYNVKETIGDICYHGIHAQRELKRPDTTVPKNEEEWTALAKRLYSDAIFLRAMEEEAVAVKKGDNKGAWRIINILRGQDAQRLAEAMKKAVI